MKLSNLVIPVLCAVAAPVGACGASGSDHPTSVPTGSWGGQHVALEVTASGATIQFDCAHGQITVALSLDADARFETPGTFTSEGGPAREGGAEDSRPAVYTGRLQGDELTLSVRLTDEGLEAGPFTARRGAKPRLFRCY
jgi:hypothetical protein